MKIARTVAVWAVLLVAWQVRTGTAQADAFYSLQRPNWPPLPVNRFPDLPVSELGKNSFLIDDRSIDYDQIRMEAEAEAVMNGLSAWAEGPSAPAAASYSPSDLWLEILSLENDGVHMTLHGTE